MSDRLICRTITEVTIRRIAGLTERESGQLMLHICGLHCPLSCQPVPLRLVAVDQAEACIVPSLKGSELLVPVSQDQLQEA